MFHASKLMYNWHIKRIPSSSKLMLNALLKMFFYPQECTETAAFPLLSKLIWVQTYNKKKQKQKTKLWQYYKAKQNQH